MKYESLLIVGISLMIPFTGCAVNQKHTASPGPRPPGTNPGAYEAPRGFPAIASEAPGPEKPTGTITLRDALSLAFAGNPELTALSWEVRAAEAGMLQAGAVPNPEISMEMENLGGRGEYRGLEGAEKTLQLSQLIELGGKRFNRTRFAALERDLAGWDHETKRLDVLAATTIAFVDVLAAQEHLHLSEETLRLSRQFFSTVAERVKAGKVSPTEETKARIVLSTSRIQLEKAERILEAARKQLASMWGDTSPVFEKVTGELDAIGTVPPAALLDSLVARNPEISRWPAEIEQRRSVLAMEKAQRIPDLAVSGGVRRFGETGGSAFVLGLSIPLPLFDRNRGAILEAESRLAKAAEERRASDVYVRTTLAGAYESLLSVRMEALALKKDVLPAAEHVLDAASEGYRQGKFGFLDVLDAQRTLVDMKGRYIEALAGYHKAVAEVERLIGQGLDSTLKLPEK